MTPTPSTIDDVLSTLENIINDSIQSNNPLGYFAALYHRVTQKVKEGIQEEYFDDNIRMEKLDVIFATRYIDAYYAYQQGASTTKSWNLAFLLSTQYWPIVLQHLLIGMNAHISLDLGIAAAEISRGKQLESLHDDFNRINTILSSLVDEVENNLATIWPFFRKILKWTRQADNIIADFSMELARDGAWRFAKKLSTLQDDEWKNAIMQRDEKVARKASIITTHGFFTKLLLRMIRLSERGSVADKIKVLQHTEAPQNIFT